VDCVLKDEGLLKTGDDGQAVVEMIPAAYESAGTARRGELPHAAPRDKMLQKVWRR